MDKPHIISTVLGQLIQDDRFEDWWNKVDVSIPFFANSKMQITYTDFDPNSDKSFLKDADEAVGSFLNKNDNDRFKISALVFKNFEMIKEEVTLPYWSDDLGQIKKATDIWNFVNPIGISVSRRPYQDQDIYIDISCECEWEPEHGLQLVFRQGKKLTRISQIDGHLTDADAYDIPDEEDELLSKF